MKSFTYGVISLGRFAITYESGRSSRESQSSVVMFQSSYTSAILNNASMHHIAECQNFEWSLGTNSLSTDPKLKYIAKTTP